MFNYEMTYTNNRNQTFTFGKTSGLYLDTSQLFDYAWSVETAQHQIVSVQREPREIPTALCFLAADKDKENINEFDTIIDYDARIGKPGMLRFNGWEIHGLFITSEASDYEWKEGIMRRDMVFFTTDQDWTRKSTIHFRKQANVTDEGMGYPHDFPHDYAARSVSASFVNPSPFPSEFVLRVYGPVANPYVVISGNVYQVNVHLAADEQLLIDSRDHTQVLKISPYGDKTNVFDAAVFGAPGSGSYIFERIKPGANPITSSPGISFDLELYEGRSTPRWYETRENTDLTIQGT